MRRGCVPRRRVAVLVAGLAIAGSLTACSTAEPGSAAVVGDTKIAESTIGDQVRKLNETAGLPPETPDAERTRRLVSYNIGYELVRATADEVRAKVTPAQLDQVFNQQVEAFGGEDALQKAAAEAGIAPESIRRDLETQLLVSAIANQLAPGLPQEQQQSAVFGLISQTADRLGVEVAPKYGQWDSATLQIVAPTDPVSRPETPPAPALPIQQ